MANLRKQRHVPEEKQSMLLKVAEEKVANGVSLGISRRHRSLGQLLRVFAKGREANFLSNDIDHRSYLSQEQLPLENIPVPKCAQQVTDTCARGSIKHEDVSASFLPSIIAFVSHKSRFLSRTTLCRKLQNKPSTVMDSRKKISADVSEGGNTAPEPDSDTSPQVPAASSFSAGGMPSFSLTQNCSDADNDEPEPAHCGHQSKAAIWSSRLEGAHTAHAEEVRDNKNQKIKLAKNHELEVSRLKNELDASKYGQSYVQRTNDLIQGCEEGLEARVRSEQLITKLYKSSLIDDDDLIYMLRQDIDGMQNHINRQDAAAGAAAQNIHDLEMENAHLLDMQKFAHHTNRLRNQNNDLNHQIQQLQTEHKQSTNANLILTSQKA
ncbi:MAG: hypothetical protein Q9164_003625 [Protoblastenia rupestris]